MRSNFLTSRVITDISWTSAFLVDESGGIISTFIARFFMRQTQNCTNRDGDRLMHTTEFLLRTTYLTIIWIMSQNKKLFRITRLKHHRLLITPTTWWGKCQKWAAGFGKSEENIPCASGIWTDLTWLWWFGIRLEPISGNELSIQKNFTYPKSGQSEPKISISLFLSRSNSLIHFVEKSFAFLEDKIISRST